MALIRDFGTIDGVAVQAVELRSPGGAVASIVTIGAAVRGLTVPVGDGAPRPVVLGYETIEGYRLNPSHLGVIAGRCANRIGGGRFRLDGREVRLAVNEGGVNTLHGGPVGFTRRIWRLEGASEDAVELSLVSEDGDQGWPGRVEARVVYRLTGAASLEISASATCDAPTPVNLTNHAYFTLNGGADCRDHRLELSADFYTPVDAAMIPTGAILPVAGTEYDFRRPRRIDGDYDVAFALSGAPGEVALAARVWSPDERLRLEVETDQPALQLYTAAHLGATGAPHDGIAHGPHAGFCLEAQGFVDAPNKRQFPSVVLRPGARYRHRTAYRFFAD